MRICKIFTFNSAHWLPGHPTCGKMHGHTYKLEVVVESYCLKNGMVMDFSELTEIVGHRVLSQLDHTILNEVAGLEMPTAENLAMWIWLRLDGVLSKPESAVGYYYEPACAAGYYYEPALRSVKVWETPTAWAVVEGRSDYVNMMDKPAVGSPGTPGGTGTAPHELGPLEDERPAPLASVARAVHEVRRRWGE